MKKIALLCGGILLLSISAAAQDLPKYDVFGGYSFIHFTIGNPHGDLSSNLNGGDASVAFYPTKLLGIVGDFSVSKMSTLKQSGTSFDVDATVVSYLFGPRVRFGSKAVTPFAQILFGGAHIGDITSSSTAVCGSSTPCTLNTNDTRNAFALIAEAGVDIKVAKHLAIRGQGGYLMTRFDQSVGNGMQATATQNNARILAGIVIH